jgi:hypothetical protein
MNFSELNISTELPLPKLSLPERKTDTTIALKMAEAPYIWRLHIYDVKEIWVELIMEDNNGT